MLTMVILMKDGYRHRIDGFIDVLSQTMLNQIIIKNSNILSITWEIENN